MEDSYLTQPWLVEMLEKGGKYESFALDDIHLYSLRDILGNGISFAASKFYESRAYILPGSAATGSSRARGGKKAPGRCRSSQVHRWPELVLAKLGG